jgi:hypothetical protein
VDGNGFGSLGRRLVMCIVGMLALGVVLRWAGFAPSSESSIAHTSLPDSYL